MLLDKPPYSAMITDRLARLAVDPAAVLKMRKGLTKYRNFADCLM